MSRPRDKEPLLGPGPLAASRDHGEVYGKGGPRVSHSGTSHSWLMRIVLLAIIVALVGVGVWAVELQKNLQDSRTTLAGYNQVINDLKAQLSVTDESVNQTSAQAEDKLKELDSEIRKLWDNVWKRAKTRIDQNEATLKSLKKQQASFLTALNNQTGAIKTFDETLNEYQRNLNALTVQANLIPDNQAKIAAAQKSVSDLISELEALKGSVKTLRGDQTVLAAQSGEFEEWIDSFNGYRRQVTQKLYEIEQALQPPAPAAAQ